MTINTQLGALERDLEADLVEARKELEMGRDAALAELNAHRDSLGALCGEAVREIESLTHDADEDLNKVRARLGELNLLVAEEEVKDLRTFDQFRDRILQAMAEAEDDLERLKMRGDAWSERESAISEAWDELSRRLEYVRLHLVHEAELAITEFESGRRGLIADLEQRHVAADKPRVRTDMLTKLGRELDRFMPAVKAFFLHPDSTVPKPPGERRE